MTDIIHLGSIDKAFTQGGNRLCFIHPTIPGRCIKVIRPDRTPAIRRRHKSFPKNLRSLRAFDENWNELKTIERIHHTIGTPAFALMPRYYGMVNTDLGAGLCSDLIIDDDGKISMSLKQYLWVNGLDKTLKQTLRHFSQQWATLQMPSRDLLLHNIVVQQTFSKEHTLSPKRLVVIDGLGWPNLSWLYYAIGPLARSKAKRKTERLNDAVNQLLEKKNARADWGYHGWLNDEQRQITHHE